MVPILPGLAVCALGVACAAVVHRLAGDVSPLMVAVVFGVLLANCGLDLSRARPGLAFAARHLLRAGVVLLGLQLAVQEVLDLGAPLIAVVVAVVGVTFFGTRWLGARLGVGRDLSLLIASGFSICGASAIAAVDGAVGADEEEVAYAVALVTLCGTACIIVLPFVGARLGLDPRTFGAWVGASVHDVGQVVATASTRGEAALHSAVVVKLGRVVMLAPIVIGVGLGVRARVGASAAGRPVASGAVDLAEVGADRPLRRPPLVPLFVVGFLAMAGLRSVGVVPDAVVGDAKSVQDVLLAAALVGLGSGVDVRRLRRLGGRPLLLAASATGLISLVALAGVTVATR